MISKFMVRVDEVFSVLFGFVLPQSIPMQTFCSDIIKNKLIASLFFTQTPAKIQQLATIKFPWNKIQDTPNFTGIPPHVTLLSEMQGKHEDFRKMKTDLVDSFRAELD